MKVITTEERLIDIFSDIDKHPDFPIKEITKKVAIVSTPRCGSSMFCDVLRNTDRVGDPKEWINKRYLSAYSRYFGINIKDVDFSKYLDFIFRKTRTNEASNVAGLMRCCCSTRGVTRPMSPERLHCPAPPYMTITRYITRLGLIPERAGAPETTVSESLCAY